MANLQKVLKKASLLKSSGEITPLEKSVSQKPVKKTVQSTVANVNLPDGTGKGDLEQKRIQTLMKNKEKIDFGARKQLSGQVQISQTKKKNQKSRNQVLREAYAQAEEQAQKHFEETLKKENKNLKNLYKDQQRFQQKIGVKKPKKKWYKTWKLAAVTTGGTIA